MYAILKSDFERFLSNKILYKNCIELNTAETKKKIR